MHRVAVLGSCVDARYLHTVEMALVVGNVL